jgi:hypothetical protein
MKQFLRFYGAPIAIVLLGLLVAFLFMAPAQEGWLLAVARWRLCGDG